MNTQSPKHNGRKNTGWLGVSILLVLAILVSSCKPAKPKTVTPTQPIPPTSTVVEATPTLINDTGLPAIDSGAPLPPQLINQKPGRGEELPLSGEIELKFDQPMDANATAAAWQMTDPDGKVVSGEISWPATTTLKFVADQSLQSGTLYTASLSDKAASAEGVKLNEPIVLEFSTAGDLEVSQVFPADGTSDVQSNAVITVIFNRPVVALVTAEEQSQLPSPITISPSISGRGEWVNTSVYAFQPDHYFAGGTTYKVQVEAGLSDAVGQSKLAEDYSWEFNTAAPAIGSFEIAEKGITNPENYYAFILLDEYFRINFLQPMDRTSSQAALSLSTLAGENVPVKTQWLEDDTRLVITPTQRLALDTDYILNLDESAQAVDGGQLAQGLEWTFVTIPPPSIVSVHPQNGGTQEYFDPWVHIQFASPMNIQSVKDRILVTPKPEEDILWHYDEYGWAFNAYFLEPSTRYEIRFLPGMQDIYGNPIQQGQTVRFTTAARPPSASLQMPYQPAIFRYGAAPEAQQFYIRYRNVDTVQLKLSKLSIEQFMALLSGKIPIYNYAPPENDLVWQATEVSTAALNQLVLKSFRPVTTSGDQLPMGMYFLHLDCPEIQTDAKSVDSRLIIVSNASLTFKSTSTDALTWLTDLKTGKPLGGVPVTLYNESSKPIGEGISNAEGLVYTDVPTPVEPYESRFAVAGNPDKPGQVFAFTSSQWDSGIPLYDYGIWSSYYAPANQPKAYAYTDRPIYRPGQPVYFKSIVRVDNDLDYSLPPQKLVRVTIENYKEMVYERNLRLSEFGSFDDQLALDSEAALGAYTINVYLPDNDIPIGSVSFTVAEYRKPEFQVSVTVKPAQVLSGQEFTAQVDASYYSGGGVANAQVDWTLRSDQFNFSPPPEFSSYSFSDYSQEQEEGYYPDQQWPPSEPSSQVVAQGQGVTDQDGRFVITLPADLSKSKTGRTLTFEATVTDLSNAYVSSRAAVVAHLSKIYPGVRPETYVGSVGQESVFEIIALDWDGKPVPKQPVDVEIVEQRWYSVQEQDPNGQVRWKTSVENIPVDSFTDILTDAGGEASVSFIPPNGGTFLAIVTTKDDLGNEGKASTTLWVSGPEYIPWPQTNDRSFDLIADRSTYAPGDTAEILIASPFQGQSYALVTVERGRIHQKDVLLLTSNSTVYKLPITADMAPNAYISVLVVKGVDQDNPRPNYKMGIMNLKVDRSQQTLDVQLSADRTQAGPGDVVTFTVVARDGQGKPVSADVSLALSDLATLSLVDPNSPPILDYFYSERTLGVWTSVPIGLGIEDYNATITEYIAEGIGGGAGGGKGIDVFGVMEIRQQFPDTALWEARLLTDANGQAVATVTLPDNLTTWRLDARAATKDTRVGQNTLDIVSSKPLLVRPQTPRFFVVNDQVTLGTAVHNNTKTPLKVTVSLDAQGLSLQDQAAQNIDIPAGQQAYVTWDAVVAPDAKRVDLVFSAEGQAPDGTLYQDASRPPQGSLDNQGLPVYRYEAHETVGTSGQMLQGGTVVEAISLPTLPQPPSGELLINLSPSLAAGMTDGLTYLEHYPYECVEQTVSRFLPNVITTRAMQSAGLSDPTLEANLEEQVSTALQRLYNWQNADGGWGWWAGETSKSDVQNTAYVTLGLIEAKEADTLVSQAVVDRAVNYLIGKLIYVTGLTEPAKLNQQAFVLYVLGRAGSPNVSRTVQLYAQRQGLALYGKAYLLQSLYLIDPGDPRIQTLLSDINSAAILSASGAHWEEEQADPWSWNTDTRTTAIILSAMSQIDPQNPLNANAVRWLMSNRTNGHWQGTQETAWSLMALTNWMEASGELEADYDYAVSLNDDRLGGGKADAETLRETLQLRVDLAELLVDQPNRLAFARDEGPGALYYTAFLDVNLPVEEVQAIDRGVIISRSYYPLLAEDGSAASEPVTQAQLGDSLLARLTIVVPSDVHYLVVDDPLPAGLEAVNQSLLTSLQNITVPQQSYTMEDVYMQGWGWWFFDNIQVRDEKVVLSASYLPAGTYVFTYLVRAATAGAFHAIPPTAQEFYFPDVYGRGEGSLFTITD